MKKSDVRYDKIVDLNVIDANYKHITRNTKHKTKLIKFDMFYSSNINYIYTVLKNRNYKHGNYNIFLIKDPKYRIVMSENIIDKTINHIVSNAFLKDVIYPKLIDENVATRMGKGTDEAIKLCKKFFIRMNNKYKDFYILKFDISKYFYNIDHDILKGYLSKIYKDEEVLKILYETIDATDFDYINEKIEKLVSREIEHIKTLNAPNAEEKIAELKRIPRYQKGRGLGIGSLSNQIYAVFYLNSVDHFIKEILNIREYVRFMDDGIIFCESKEKLVEIWKMVEEKINGLNLKLNDKTRIYSSREGFDFVGYRFIAKNGKMIVRVKNNTKNKMKKKFKNLSKHDFEKYLRVKASYKGVFLYSNCKSIFNKYFDN